MKLLTFEVATPLGPFQRLGALVPSVREDGSEGERVVDLNLACAAMLMRQGPDAQTLANVVCPSTMLAFLHAESRALTHANATLMFFAEALANADASSLMGPRGERIVWSPQDVRWLSPLPEPVSLRDFYAFEGHVRTGFEKRSEPIPEAWYRRPVYYKGNPRTVIGPSDDVRWPKYSERLDFELELACVIGKAGVDIPLERAGEHIVGYTIMNDWSARDVQRDEMACRLGPAKGKDFATSLGPLLVTADELGDGSGLEMSVRVNGEEWSRGTSSDMHWSFAQMVSYVSQDEPLTPGEVFGSGTMTRGCGLELDRWIQAGDLVELAIRGIGTLATRVVRERS